MDIPVRIRLGKPPRPGIIIPRPQVIGIRHGVPILAPVPPGVGIVRIKIYLNPKRVKAVFPDHGADIVHKLYDVAASIEHIEQHILVPNQVDPPDIQSLYRVRAVQVNHDVASVPDVGGGFAVHGFAVSHAVWFVAVFGYGGAVFHFL